MAELKKKIKKEEKGRKSNIKRGRELEEEGKKKLVKPLLKLL
jgi:hypothetical protein